MRGQCANERESKSTKKRFARWGYGTENARNRPTTNQIVDREFKEYDKVKNNIERMR